MPTRRDFVRGTAAAASVAFASRMAFANPLGLPLGIQLFSVREQMTSDFEGALAAVAAAGFTEVEAAALPKKPAKEIRAALDRAGLKCVSAHRGFADFNLRFDETLAYDKEIGVKFSICSSPGRKDLGTPAAAPPASPPGVRPVRAPLTLDDWLYNADAFNTFGEKAAAMGVQFGYHNHTAEVTPVDGKLPLVEMLRRTDAKKVTFEMDCGWVVVGGANPVELMQQHPGRFSLLHVKDFNFPVNPTTGKKEDKVTEMGRGTINYAPIFAQAKKNQHIAHAFVEQEAFDIPWKESLQVDADFMKKMKA